MSTTQLSRSAVLTTTRYFVAPGTAVQVKVGRTASTQPWGPIGTGATAGGRQSADTVKYCISEYGPVPAQFTAFTAQR